MLTLGRLCSEVIHMLNEKRVKHMVKLASYETKKGTEDIKIDSYYQEDYVGLNVLCTLLWLTTAYVIVLGLLGIVYMDTIWDKLTVSEGTYLILAIVVLYVVLMIVSRRKAHRFYKEKYSSATNNMKEFARGLEELIEMYESEAK